MPGAQDIENLLDQLEQAKLQLSSPQQDLEKKLDEVQLICQKVKSVHQYLTQNPLEILVVQSDGQTLKPMNQEQ